MRIRYVLLVSFIILSSLSTVSAQHTELGVFRGISSYNGDLAPGIINMVDKQNAIGFFIRKNFDDYMALEIGLTMGRIGASDTDATVPENVNRNLSFTSALTEYSAKFIYNFNYFDICYSRVTHAPYAFAGVALFKFDPVAELNGVNYSLQPIGTEGQYNQFRYGTDRLPYKLTQLSIPIGIGYKYRIYRNTTLGFEIGWRFTFTDYIDDVSKTVPYADSWNHVDGPGYALSDRSLDGSMREQGTIRGNEKTKDSYHFIGISIAFSLKQCVSGQPLKCFPF